MLEDLIWDGELLGTWEPFDVAPEPQPEPKYYTSLTGHAVGETLRMTQAADGCWVYLGAVQRTSAATRQARKSRRFDLRPSSP